MIIKTDNQNIIADLQPFKVTEDDIFTQGKKVNGYKAISYVENKEPICIVSDTYGLLQHDDVISKTFEDLDELGVNYEVQQITVNNTRKRNTMATTITLPDIKINVDGSDLVGTIYVNNGTDGMTSFTREFGFYRFICQNGMKIPQQLLISERLKHRKNIIMMNLEEGITSVANYIPKFGEILEKAQQITLDDILLKNMMIFMKFSPRVFESIVSGEYLNKYTELIDEQANMKTLWGMYQVMTNYLTHVTGPRSIRTEQSMNERLYNFVLQQVA